MPSLSCHVQQVTDTCHAALSDRSKDPHDARLVTMSQVLPLECVLAPNLPAQTLAESLTHRTARCDFFAWQAHRQVHRVANVGDYAWG